MNQKLFGLDREEKELPMNAPLTLDHMRRAKEKMIAAPVDFVREIDIVSTQIYDEVMAGKRHSHYPYPIKIQD